MVRTYRVPMQHRIRVVTLVKSFVSLEMRDFYFDCVMSCFNLFHNHRSDDHETREHYKKGYFMPPVVDMSWTQREYPEKAPVWCSVDLRDGNQALIIPRIWKKNRILQGLGRHGL